MKSLIQLVLLATTFFLFPVCYLTVTAQTVSDSQPETSDTSKSAHWLFSLTLRQVFDSNIDQDDKHLKSFGIVPGFGISYRSSAKHPSFRFNYEVGRHKYSKTDRWNRTSHFFEGSFERRFLRNLSAETDAVVSLKGSNEDRELADQYGIEEQVKYRLNRKNRFRVYGAYRIKRYQDVPGRNAINPSIGAKYQRVDGNRALTLGYRYDVSRPINPRFRYIRRTYSGEFSTPVANYGSLTLGARFQSKLYSRLVTVGGARVPRDDEKWSLSTSWDREVRKNLRAGAFYVFERQSSNLPDKRFAAHQIGAFIKLQWWR